MIDQWEIGEHALITLNDNGSITISDLIDNYLVEQTYYGYTPSEAWSLFCEVNV